MHIHNNPPIVFYPYSTVYTHPGMRLVIDCLLRKTKITDAKGQVN